MSNKLLVPIEVLKANSYIEGNAEPSKLKQAALEAQRVETRSILGSALYAFFVDAVSDDGTLTGLTATQQELYDTCIVPMMSMYTQAQYIYATHYQISNVGVTNISGNNNKSATDEAVDKMHKMATNRANYHAQRTKDMIVDPDNYEDLGRMYYGLQQQVEPQTKVAHSYVYTGRRGRNNNS